MMGPNAGSGGAPNLDPTMNAISLFRAPAPARTETAKAAGDVTAFSVAFEHEAKAVMAELHKSK
jgi:hypothetical protein